MKFIFVSCLIGLLLAPAAARADGFGRLPANQQQWMACDQDSDCTSIVMGCSFWQPINKDHVRDMRNAYMAKCLSRTDPGPQPPSICAGKVCENGPLPPK
jgi:hypothetical protein